MLNNLTIIEVSIGHKWDQQFQQNNLGITTNKTEEFTLSGCLYIYFALNLLGLTAELMTFGCIV